MNWYLKVMSQYADFRGRARRKEFWMFFLFNMIFAYGLQILASAAEVPALLFVAVIYTFAVLAPSLTVGVRRMHDVGKSGWYLLIPIYSIVLAVIHGENGENQYRKDPKQTQGVKLQKV